MPEKTKKQLERDKLSRDAAKELKKMKKKQEGFGITLEFGSKKKPFPLIGSIEKPEQKKKKKKKNPLGLKGGKGKPERTEKPGVPHGVDKKTQEGGQILNIAKGGSVSKFPDLSGDGKVTKKDILMGRGVVKAAKGGLAGRLATRGYGKARK